jgi:hypothetical protein
VGQPLSPLFGGLALMGVGLGWLLIIAGAKSAFGSEATMLRYGFHLSRQNLEFMKQFRPVYMAVLLWVFRPIGWLMLAGGFCLALYGFF